MRNKNLPGRLIAFNRKMLSLKQKDLSKKLGISTQFLSNIERGMCSIPASLILRTEKALKLNKLSLAKLVLHERNAKFYKDLRN